MCVQQSPLALHFVIQLRIGSVIAEHGGEAAQEHLCRGNATHAFVKGQKEIDEPFRPT